MHTPAGIEGLPLLLLAQHNHHLHHQIASLNLIHRARGGADLVNAVLSLITTQHAASGEQPAAADEPSSIRGAVAAASGWSAFMGCQLSASGLSSIQRSTA